MKAESLVIADQHAAVNTFPGLVHTARHTMGVGFTRRRCANRKAAVERRIKKISPDWLFRHECLGQCDPKRCAGRSEEPTSELQSLIHLSYAVLCLKQKKNN